MSLLQAIIGDPESEGILSFLIEKSLAPQFHLRLQVPSTPSTYFEIISYGSPMKLYLKNHLMISLKTKEIYIYSSLEKGTLNETVFQILLEDIFFFLKGR